MCGEHCRHSHYTSPGHINERLSPLFYPVLLSTKCSAPLISCGSSFQAQTRRALLFLSGICFEALHLHYNTIPPAQSNHNLLLTPDPSPPTTSSRKIIGPRVPPLFFENRALQGRSLKDSFPKGFAQKQTFCRCLDKTIFFL